MQHSYEKFQTSLLQSQQFGKYLSYMASDHEFVPRSQKLVNQIAKKNVEIGQRKCFQKKCRFLVFSDETMLELNNDRLLRIRRSKTEDLNPIFWRNSMVFHEKIDELGVHSIKRRQTTNSHGKQSGF